MRLIDRVTGRELAVGDWTHANAETKRMADVKIVKIEPPTKPGSTGRVVVEFLDKRTMEPCAFYPAVIGAEFRE